MDAPTAYGVRHTASIANRLPDLGCVLDIATSEGKFFNEDTLWEFQPGLVRQSKVEVDADVGVVAILVAGNVLDCEDVEGNQHAVYGYQEALALLVKLQAENRGYEIRSTIGMTGGNVRQLIDNALTLFVRNMVGGPTCMVSVLLDCISPAER